MKKTLTVNLGGTVYHIDEDAYVLLDNYLNNLKYHFRSETDADEIVRDMENRIAELFSEYISHGQQVITIENVEEVIARMGRPEEINTDDESNENTQDYRNNTNGDDTVKRRLFRNPDDKVLGGVVSGLAAYFGWDFSLCYIVAWVHFGIYHSMDYNTSGTYRYRETSDERRAGEYGEYRENSDRRF